VISRQTMRVLAKQTVRVALVNDYEIVLAGIAKMLEPYPQIRIVDMAAQREPIRLADVALFDTYSHRGLGLDRVKQLIDDPRVGATAIYTFHPNTDAVRAALDAGADGVLAKALTSRQLCEALLRLANGERVIELADGRLKTEADWPGRADGLTFKESELLSLLATGATNRQLAKALYISENTVKTRLRLLFAKLGVSNRTQAAAFSVGHAGFTQRSGERVLAFD
jgi:DNA-binding NarL/FixJ family response regulator